MFLELDLNLFMYGLTFPFFRRHEQIYKSTVRKDSFINLASSENLYEVVWCNHISEHGSLTCIVVTRYRYTIRLLQYEACRFCSPIFSAFM